MSFIHTNTCSITINPIHTFNNINKLSNLYWTYNNDNSKPKINNKMAITRIGLNLNATQNWTVPVFNTSKTGTDYLREMPGIVNKATNYAYGWGVLLTLFVALYTSLNEQIGKHGFGYDEGQSWAISSGITFIFGLLFTMIGYVQNFVAVGVMGALFVVIGLIIIYINNNK